MTSNQLLIYPPYHKYKLKNIGTIYIKCMMICAIRIKINWLKV